MLDINLVRENPEVVRAALQLRNMDGAIVDQLQSLDLERRTLLARVEALKAERNAVSRVIGKMKDPVERQEKIDAMKLVGDQITGLDEQIRQVEEKLLGLVAIIPNIPEPTTPPGRDEHDNVVVRVQGEIPVYDFTPSPHWDLGPRLGIIDFDRGVKITGSRFYVLSGAGGPPPPAPPPGGDA
jgi:seryl-tRNA synthetase